MDKIVKISVIIPVYNVEQYLRQCLDSVINQKFHDMEIILVNDGSTDDSLSICQEYREKDKRIVLIDQKNAGLAAARQAGLEYAGGEYVTFVDSDDWLEVEMYEKMYQAAAESGAEIVFCNVYRNESKKEAPYLPSGFYDRQAMIQNIFPRLLAGFDKDGCENTIRWCNWLRLYKKSLIDKNHIRFDKRFRRSQDLPFTFECTLHAGSYYYLGEDYLYHNRMNYDSLSKGYTKNMWQLIKPLILYLQNVVDNYQEYDFQEQMNRRAALFVFECCENENKPNNKRKLWQRLKTIREIMHDSDAKRWVKEMNVEGMRKVNKIYALCFKFHLPIVFYMVSEKRFSERKADYRKRKQREENTRCIRI